MNLKELRIIKDALNKLEHKSDEVLNLIDKIEGNIVRAKGYNDCLWEFLWDFKNGKVSGIFKASKEQVEKDLIGKYVWFGEIFGKHSEVYGEIKEDEIVLLDDDPLSVINSKESGYNPLDYVEHICSKCLGSYPGREINYRLPKKICYKCRVE